MMAATMLRIAMRIVVAAASDESQRQRKEILVAAFRLPGWSAFGSALRALLLLLKLLPVRVRRRQRRRFAEAQVTDPVRRRLRQRRR
jgi:hypothetical protein